MTITALPPLPRRNLRTDRDSRHAAAANDVADNHPVGTFHDDASRSRIPELAIDDLITRPAAIRIGHIGSDRNIQRGIQRNRATPLFIGADSHYGCILKIAVIVGDLNRLAHGKPRVPIILDCNGIGGGCGNMLQFSVDGDAIVKEDPLKHATLDIRAGVGVHRVESVRLVGDDGSLGRAIRLGAQDPVASEKMIAASVPFQDRGETVAHKGDILDGAVAAEKQTDFLRGVLIPRHQPIANLDICRRSVELDAEQVIGKRRP